MPQLYIDKQGEIRHSDDIQDIITAVPSWVLRWGITMFFIALLLIFGMASLIQYPDIIKTQLVIQSPNAPKPIIAKIAGKINKILVHENSLVVTDQPLAFLESTGDHLKILELSKQLKQLQDKIVNDEDINHAIFDSLKKSEFGELQQSFQIFFQEFLNYKATIYNGYLTKKRLFLNHDLKSLSQQKDQLHEQKDIDSADYKLARQEYEMHKKLSQEQVETKAEFRQAESKFLLKKSPIVQTEGALINADNSIIAKQKEILEIDNQIIEQKAKFLQSINSLISQVNEWRSKYILSAQQTGLLNFAGIIQENQIVSVGQEIFYVTPKNEDYFGEMNIPQMNMGKVKENQNVLIKLRGYPFEEYGMIRGKIAQISDVPIKDSIFTSKVSFNLKRQTAMNKTVHLKQGMLADAEIITKNSTILERVSWNIFRLINKN